MDKILKTLNINQPKITIKPKKEKIFNKVKNGVPPVENYNFQADLLHLPTTKDGYKYLLTVCDLANNKFDMQEMKSKTSKSCLDAYKLILKRKIIKLPVISLKTDNGGEFKDEFSKFLKDNKILHTISLPYRHQQMANIESLNKQVGKIFTLYMNDKEMETGEQFNEWDEIIKEVRTELNKHRVIKLPKYKDWDIQMFDPEKAGEAKYKIGDMVYYKIQTPKNALNNRINDTKFRQGDYRYDPVPKRIIKVIYMPDIPYYRYILDDRKNVSYSENELLPSTEIEDKYYVEKFINKKVVNKKTFYLVKWKDYSLKESTWEEEKQLKEDLGEPHFKKLVDLMKK